MMDYFADELIICEGESASSKMTRTSDKEVLETKNAVKRIEILTYQIRHERNTVKRIKLIKNHARLRSQYNI